MSRAAGEVYSIDELRAIVTPVAEKYGVAEVYLFGSVAMGDYNENSDYDFYIELDEAWDLFRLSGFFQDLHEAVGHEIDLLDSMSVDPDFLKTIRSEGAVIFEL